MNLLLSLFLFSAAAIFGNVVVDAVVCNTTNTILNEMWRNQLISKHNDRRATLAAGQQVLEDGSYNIPAKEIPPLTYNCELEALAQASTNQYCATGNSTLHLNESYNIHVWDSINKTMGFYVDCANIYWWGEIAWPTCKYLSNSTIYKKSSCESFARMAWAKTKEFGCGYSYCANETIAICIYRNDSVVPNEPIYEPLPPQTTLKPPPAQSTLQPNNNHTLAPTQPTSASQCPIVTTDGWDTTIAESTPYTTIVTRKSTTQYFTEPTAVPTSTYATVTPTSEEEYPTTPRGGCPGSSSRTTRMEFETTIGGGGSQTTPGGVVTTPSPTLQCDITTTNSPLTPALRKIFVDKHNSYRSILANGNAELPDGTFASPSSNMYKMEYSCDLEKVAQEWADRCVWEHSPPEHRNGGENLYQLTSGASGAGKYMESSVTGSNDLWWSELKQYGGITRTNVTLTPEVFNSGIGHWSQMAWSSTQTVGCGFRECPKPDGSIMHFVVCNYRPTGNYLNRDIYEIGHPCARNTDCTAIANSFCEVSTGLCDA